MKFILYAVFVIFFVALPMYILNTLVMPDMQSLQQTYTHANDLATAAAH